MDDQITARLAKLIEIRSRKDLKLKKTKHLKETFTDFSGKERPLVIRYYQVQGILHLRIMKRFLLGDDTGLGKTLETIAALCYIWEQDPNRKAIILTTKSSIQQWAGEFAKFTTGIKTIVCTGDKNQRAAARKAYLNTDEPVVIIMGYRSMVGDFTNMQNWKDHVLVADECVVFKNPATQVHQVCRHLASQADRVWALTATMIKNHLMEGFGIFQVIIPGLFGMTATQFMMYYALVKMQSLPGGRHVPVIVGYLPQKIAEFREVISPYYIGRAKYDVASELPTLTSKVINVGMTIEQDSKYSDAIEGLLGLVKDGAVVEQEISKLTAIAYCQEIVGHMGMIGFVESESPKIDALVELITEGDFADEKVIVFSRFEKMISFTMDRLKKEKVSAVRVTGKENTEQRKKAMDSFQNPESKDRVICITTAGSEAINLQAAKVLVCLDTPWSAGEFLQLVGRMIRIGSEHDKCYVIHMVANKTGKDKETIDHRIMEVLGKKMHLVEAVLGKRIKGEKDSEVAIAVDNDISDLFASLKSDANKERTK